MKIGLVIYGSLDTISGGYLYDRKLVEYLRAQGDEVEIISLPWRNYAAHLSDNLRFKLPADLDLLIQDELNHPSLIFANAGKHPYPIISLVHHLRCSELRPKWENHFYRMIERKYLQSVDGFIFNSQTTKNVVNKTISYSVIARSVSDEAISNTAGRLLTCTAPNAVRCKCQADKHRPRNDDRVKGKPSIVAYPPTDRFGTGISESEIKARANKEPFRIVFLGNVIYRKGLHTLLSALKDLKCRLDVVGSLSTDPKYAREMQRQTAMLNLQSSVFFHGSLENDALQQLLQQAHLLVVPSSYEGFGIVYLEGMAFGLPAIGTTAGAASEIIEDGKTGYLIAPDDSQMLAERIQSLINDRARLSDISINAVRRYQAQPTWEQTAKRIREFLHVTASA